jgi:hypothetical protein
MKKIVSVAVMTIFAGLAFAASLSAQTTKRGRFTISVFGGGFGGVEFLSGFTGEAGVAGGQPGGGNVIPAYDADADGPLVQNLSAGTYGFSLGYISGVSARPVNGRYRLSLYAEISFCPTVKFADGIETRTWQELDQFQWIEKRDTFPQTGRKAGMAGATFGAVWMPFAKAPLGLDLGFGLWRFTQEYTSGTLQFLAGTTDLSRVTDNSANTGLSSSGQGTLTRNHTALLFKIGLTYRILRYVSLDAALRTASYFDSHDTGWIYVESRKDVKRIEGHKLGNVMSGGITFSF